MKLKKELTKIDEQIAWWEKTVERFPLSDAYKKILVDLKDYRDIRCSQIGKNNKPA